LDEPVRVLSPRPPVTVGGETPLRDAVKVMMDAGVGTVLVLDKDGKLAGIFSERDLLLRVADAEAISGKTAVGQYMTPKPETVADVDTLAVALQKMDVGGYRHLPVVREGRPVGMISVRDMMRYITRMCQE
jgi:CBS domain-containing protein